MARRTSARMRRDAEATSQGRAWRRRGAGGADSWQEATAVHTNAHEGRHVVGGWHLEVPRVSGPWLGVWGGNTNALPHPNSYTHDFHLFCPCGTMFLQIFLFCRRRGRTTGVRFGQDNRDRVDSSPRYHQSSTCAYRV